MCCRSVGLVQRVLERNGIPSVSLSMVPDFTASVGAPRVAGIEYPHSRPLGRAGDADGQRAVLHATLEVLVSAQWPGTVIDLPFLWPDPAAVVLKEKIDLPPISQLIRRQPRLLEKLISGELDG